MIEVAAPAEPFEDAGEGVEGLLETWLVEENDRVAAGQPVADAIVVKTSFQITAPCEGTVAEILVPQGNTFAPGAILARIEETGEASASLEPPAPVREQMGRQTVPLTGVRGAVAREMALAWRHPRVAAGVDVDMTATLGVLGDGGLTPTHAVLRAVALTLPEHPRLNALVGDDAVEIAPEVNIGLAVSLDEGVIVPVIHNAERKSIQELAGAARAHAQAARDGSLPGAALRDATFTVSTLGAAGIDWFTPILNAPQVAILGVGRVTDRVIARDGAVVVAPTMTLTLVFDHRAVDGQPAAAFLAALSDRLERGEL